ncbi:hypothetical protein SAMN02910398_02413 [Butyrivibrio sp. YAB3001]|nr:hypothetical protein SAMN02910398_02413 [Butyrivibrio sp. YAB3001]
MMKNNLIDNMLKWANDRIGETKYAGCCLSFISLFFFDTWK